MRRKYKIIGLIFFLCLFAFNGNAQEIQEKRDRIHSVRKAVDSVGKIEKKEVSIVENFKHMFEDGKVSGQVRIVYAGYNEEKLNIPDTYASAIGGIVKYELAQYMGFNAGVAMYTSHDIGMLSGKGENRNDELSSSQGAYTQLGESYLNYRYDELNIRIGRQTLNTPLADSDDIRMIQNSFNAYIVSYNLSGFELTAGHIVSWQGFDAGLDDGWVNIGKDGVDFGGVSYHDMLEINAWYYNLKNFATAYYIDGGIEYNFNNDMLIHTVLQYLKEDESQNSGYAANIYGGAFEFVINGLGFNIAYNKADKKTAKQSFSGTGGGTLFTSMDTMTLDEIAEDREADAYVSGISYELKNLNFLYAYGNFRAKENSLGQKAHIVEQDIGFQYNVNDEFLLAAVYIMSEDKENSAKTEYDWQRTQVMINYNF